MRQPPDDQRCDVENEPVERSQPREAGPPLPSCPFRAADMIGESRRMLELRRQLSFVAPRDVSTLLTGPSGTGKTLIARLIHNNSPRAAGPFVEIS